MTVTATQHRGQVRRSGARRGRAYLRSFIGVLITVSFLFPILVAVSASFQTNAELFSTRPNLLPATPTLENYQTALSTQAGPLLTSLQLGLYAALVCLTIAVPAAYALALFRWRGTGAVVLVLLITQMVPTVVMATPLFLLFNDLGLLNSLVGLVIADSALGVPFAVIVLRAFMGGIPVELREAALIDGAGDFRILWSVYMPVARTGIIAVGIFVFLFAWGDFIFGVTLNPGGQVRPLTVSIYQFFQAYRVDWAGVMATAVLATLPGVVLLIAAQRYIAAGLSSGSVKE